MSLRSTCVAAVMILFSALCAEARTDRCEVYIVDVKSAQHAWEEDLLKPSNPTGDFAKVSRVVGTFNTNEIGEEVLTTKHFAFPGSDLRITVSVFYTDESLAIRVPSDPMVHDVSVLLGLLISKTKYPDAIHVPNNAVAEATYLEKGFGIRVKKLTKLRGRDYLVGMECWCNGASRPDLDKE